MKYSDPSTWHEGVSDYEVAMRPRPQLVQLVSSLIENHDSVLGHLNLKTPEVYFVRNLPEDHVARYIDGTAPKLVLVLDAARIARTAKKYGVNLVTAFEITLLHEYGHAWLDAKFASDRPADEEEEEVVELFAQAYWRTADVEGSSRVLEQYAERLEDI
jgi:hypothetical protein